MTHGMHQTCAFNYGHLPAITTVLRAWQHYCRPRLMHGLPSEWPNCIVSSNRALAAGQHVSVLMQRMRLGATYASVSSAG